MSGSMTKSNSDRAAAGCAPFFLKNDVTFRQSIRRKSIARGWSFSMDCHSCANRPKRSCHACSSAEETEERLLLRFVLCRLCCIVLYCIGFKYTREEQNCLILMTPFTPTQKRRTNQNEELSIYRGDTADHSSILDDICRKTQTAN